MVFMGGCIQPGITFIIPEGYKGEVTIFYNQDKGQPEKYEGGRRLLVIPPTGVLLTRFQIEHGNSRNYDYYYISKDGKRKPLRIYSPDEMKNDTVMAKNNYGIFYNGTTGRYGALIENLPYEWFIVSNFKGLDKISSKESTEAYKKRMKEAVGYDFISSPSAN